MQTELIYQEIGTDKSYKEVWDYQSQLQQQIINTKKNTAQLPKNYLLLCEHKAVFTIGKSGKRDNLIVNPDSLTQLGIEYHEINRGGDITYHGPGQITAYPVLDMDQFYHDLHRYVRDLEEIVIRTIAEFGLIGSRHPNYTGVWIQDDKGGRKICAIGVHMSRWVSMHGFALNVNSDLNYFRYIIPCGILDETKSVTSLKYELGHNIDYQYVQSILLNKFCEVFKIDPDRVQKFSSVL